jgi:dsDNA-specific endonuclease/ATPase MutS2
MIDKALNSGIAKLEIIHGIGYGVLKKEVHAILKRYNLRFYLTRDGGATEVYL